MAPDGRARPRPRLGLRADIIDALPLILAAKLFTLTFIALAYFYFPFNAEWHTLGFHYPTGEIDFTTRVTTWDAGHYLYLADIGYMPEQMSNAFPPLYPLMIRALSAMGLHSIIAGLLIANLTSTAALLLFYRLARQRFGREVAQKALQLMLVFPTAFYLNLIYSEGVFLLLSVLFFVAMYRRNLWLMAACAFLLPLVRLVGFAIAIPMVVYAAEAAWLRLRSTRGPLSHRLGKALGPEAVTLLAPVAGVATLCAFMAIETGDPLAMMHAQAYYETAMRGFDGLLQPMSILKDLFRSDLALYGLSNSVLDRIFFTVFLASAPLVYRRVDRPMFAFYLVMGLTPMAGSFQSYMRYLLVAFPLFLAWASYLEKVRPGRFVFGLMPLIMVQGIFVVLQASRLWVA